MEDSEPHFSKDTVVSFVSKHRVVFGVLFAIVFLYETLFAFPFFTAEKVITIPDGSSLIQTSLILKRARLIHSSTLFHVGVILLGGENSLKAGTYRVGTSDNVFVLAWRIVHGVYNIPVKRITLIEGISSRDIVRLFDPLQFPNVNKDRLLSLAQEREGYLFPDTYFIPSSANEEDIIEMLSLNFQEKLAHIDLASSTTSSDLDEILTMASIIEGEARTDIDRRIVSGILWKRIQIGMPLQVDATFAYINGKASSELTLSDLKIDSPYNTYVHKGLPLGPINNPGLEAIEAAMFPTENPYLYYLSDKNGVMHYAKTFEEHKANKEKYLK